MSELIYLGDIDDCEICPIREKNMCPSWYSYNPSGPGDPPCSSWDKDEKIEDYIDGVEEEKSRYENYLHELWEKEEEKKRKNELQRKRRYLVKARTGTEKAKLSILQDKYKKAFEFYSFVSRFSSAVNFANETYEKNSNDSQYKHRMHINPQFQQELSDLESEIEIAKENLKKKQKEIRQTEEYKNIK